MRWRRAKDEAEPAPELPFTLDLAPGLAARRDASGFLFAVSQPGDDRPVPASLTFATRGPRASLDEHVRAEGPSGGHTVDAGPARVDGHDARWSFAAMTVEGVALAVERWLLVRDGIGWVVTSQTPALSIGAWRPAALAMVESIRFTDAGPTR